MRPKLNIIIFELMRCVALRDNTPYGFYVIAFVKLVSYTQSVEPLAVLILVIASQATLLGRQEITVESLYLSSNLSCDRN
ncbi:hypothetical protein [Nostoc sp.]|uniref:hypothetical protein n=1 Tax=Nostoc sp. TaxID=1180 RepID=UPI002FF7EC1B